MSLRIQHNFLERMIVRPAVVAFALVGAMSSVARSDPGPQQQNQANRSAASAADDRRDLQGFWALTTSTPLERPDEFAGKPFLTEAEAREWEAKVTERRQRTESFESRVTPENTEIWNQFGSLLPDRRTALIVDPPDGKIPRREKPANTPPSESYDDPEARPLSERCILWNEGPPMLPNGILGHHQIVQAPGYVVIVNEMIHHARVVPLDGRPHLPTGIQQWHGDSRGHWEGDTLIVETTNLTGQTEYFGASQAEMTVVERFRRVDADTLFYAFTLTQPSAFTRAWTAEMLMTRTATPLYEYACHEGNYSLTNILRGARASDSSAATKP
jgi:hypothetical protein